jgi:PAS domain-containing protein
MMMIAFASVFTPALCQQVVPSVQVTTHKLQISHQLLFERNTLPMWVYDVKSLRMPAVNAAALKQYGYSEQEFFGLTLLDLHCAEDLTRLQGQLKRSPGGRVDAKYLAAYAP